MSRQKEIFFNETAGKIDDTLEWCMGMIEILIEKESNSDIGNAMTGVLCLLKTCQGHAEDIMKNTDF